MRDFDVVIIGAGASGMMCACTAGQRGRRVLLLDHVERIGEKIRISGGGKCNFTNMSLEPDHYLSRNQHFCTSAIRRFTQYDFIAMIDAHHIAYEERSFGQLFCTGNARQVVDMLLKECKRAAVDIQTKCEIGSVRKDEADGRFIAGTSKGVFRAESMVIATGGLTMPSIGATGFGYDIARQFGLAVVPTKPGLAPLVFPEKTQRMFCGLTGISVSARVSCKAQSFRDAVLFTHQGLSGPAILQVSNYWQADDYIVIDLLPDLDLTQTMQKWQAERGDAALKTLLANHLPKRLIQYVCPARYADKSVRQLNEKEREEIAGLFHQWKLHPSGTEGYRKAEVTRGGVDTDELSSKTFESKKVKGLYFIGEVVDITGWLGGYNLQWAWSSGYAAGQYV
ncbi:MAG: NAD(P)/FAD-dependent oxidoreductase [Candidatus Auribacterota bacterium]